MGFASANVPDKWEERPDLEAQVARVRDAVAVACGAAGRQPASVRIVAVAKFHPAEKVQAAIGLGLADIGENRVQEAAQKASQVQGATWHMVGRLQANKAAKAAHLFDWLHSLDRTDLIRPVAAGAAGRESPLQVLIQVSLAGEPQKGGCDPDEVEGILEEISRQPMLIPRGLMTVPRVGEDPRPQFARLREILRRLRDRGAPADFDQLSMGMSGDFAEAIAEGATMVRIGTMIFGPREG